MSIICENCREKDCMMRNRRLHCHRYDEDRKNLELLVYYCLTDENPPISFGRGKELLGFKFMEDMRDWYNNYHKQMEVVK